MGCNKRTSQKVTYPNAFFGLESSKSFSKREFKQNQGRNSHSIPEDITLLTSYTTVLIALGHEDVKISLKYLTAMHSTSVGSEDHILLLSLNPTIVFVLLL